ncbi:MAG: glycerol-3-phosphate 1-O-acyltransferase PlsB [Rudaea sp.]|uniref:glycerol-3-phosphate 1-O-acyltransferase PlsB n=1 Tax=Rudaea sp. TaxID=2136325 RepID=UPI0039E5D7A3
MNDSPAPFPPAASGPQAPWWLRALGALAEPWLKIRRDPADPCASLAADVPVCYVIERYGLSDTLVLEQACREAGLPEPLRPFDIAGLTKQRAMFALSRRDGWWFQKPRSKTHSATLAQLLDTVRTHADVDVQLMPVAIFVGRAPERESGWFRALFEENWGVVGRFRRLLALLLNGRSTIVHFAAPVSLRAVIAGERDAQNTLRKVSRVLRVHFQRQRAVVVGPDLSHRRTLIQAVMNAAPVQAAISTAASKDNIDRDTAAAKARAMAWEIAADQSHPFVRSASSMLTGLWDKIYSGVRMHHFDKLRAIAPGHEVVYVPCHRSHIDYLLLSYLLYRNGIAPPHIAAGVNLNLPILGSILRRGGAFFMRRSFSDPLYSTVFREYMSQLFARGVSIEYFVEGGRSRTGRTLTPRGGLLSMTLRSFLRESQRPVVFQPVYIGYERVMEGDSYVGELSGKPKEKENWFALIRALRKLRENYGEVAVNFGEPIFLTPLLDGVDANWREAIADPDAKPAWLKPAVDTLAERVAVNINRAVDVNPINLLALVLLATPKHAMAEADLIAQIDLTRDLITALPYSDRLTITNLSAAEIVAHGEKMAAIVRIAHPLGDVLASEGKAAVLLSYFRNNVLHVVAAAAWIACCFLNNRGMKREQVRRLGRVVYPFVRAELFLPWSEDEFNSRADRTIDFFVARGLLITDDRRESLQRESGQGDGAFRLRVIAQSLLQTIERYYIAIAALVRNGPNTLTAGELENLCTLTAQRLSLLQELNAPEFFDKSLFRGFIQKLRERRVIWPDAEGKLEFHADLESIVRDAKLILSREIRHGILKLTPERRNALASSDDEAKANE